MKLGSVILVTGVLCGAVYGGTKFYLHHKVESELDKGIAMVRPFMSISYREVTSDLLEGSLSVEGISISPTEIPERMRIGQIKVRGDGVGFLLDLATKGLGPEPPKKLQMQIHRMVVPLEMAYASNTSSALSLTAPKKTDVCSLEGVLQQTGLKELGYDELVVGGFMRYRMSPSNDGLSLEASYQLQGLASMRVEFDVGGALSPAAMALGSVPTFENLSFSYQFDSAYTKAVTDYCADQKKQKPKAFVDGLFAGNDASFAKALGFIPGPGLRGAFKKLISGPGELTIRANPSPNLSLSNVGLYKPEQLVDMLDLEVIIDEKIVTDMSYQMASEGKELLASLVSGEKKPEKAVKAKRKKVVMRYLPVDLPLLGKNIGRELKIYSTQAEKPREGRLTVISGEVVTVEQRIFGGKVELHIPFKTIKRVEVLTAVKID